jgi:hypothetical protein
MDDELEGNVCLSLFSRKGSRHFSQASWNSGQNSIGKFPGKIFGLSSGCKGNPNVKKVRYVWK